MSGVEALSRAIIYLSRLFDIHFVRFADHAGDQFLIGFF